jgi:hypothetical protein
MGGSIDVFRNSTRFHSSITRTCRCGDQSHQAHFENSKWFRNPGIESRLDQSLASFKFADLFIGRMPGYPE